MRNEGIRLARFSALQPPLPPRQHESCSAILGPDAISQMNAGIVPCPVAQRGQKATLVVWSEGHGSKSPVNIPIPTKID